MVLKIGQLFKKKMVKTVSNPVEKKELTMQ